MGDRIDLPIMIRTNVHLPAPLLATLRKLSKSTDLSVAELIRRSINLYLEWGVPQTSKPSHKKSQAQLNAYFRYMADNMVFTKTTPVGKTVTTRGKQPS